VLFAETQSIRSGPSPETPGLRPADLSPEIRFLLEVLAAGLDGRQPDIDDGLDWPCVIRCVRHHFVVPLMAGALAPGLPIPDEVRRELAGLRREAMLHAMRLTAELTRLARAFATAGLEVLALKGPALSVLLHGDPYRRASRDIDLLVRPGDEAAAQALLAGCGYGATPETVLPVTNAVVLRHPHRPFPVELHVRFADDDRLFPCAAVHPFDTATEVEIAGTRIRTLGPEAALAYAAYHGAKHHWARLYWLTDIAAAAKHPGIDWAQVAVLARRTGTGRHLALAAHLSEALLGRRIAGLPPLCPRDRAAILRVEATLPAVLTTPPCPDLEAIGRAGRLRVFRNEVTLYCRLPAQWALLLVWLQPTDTDRAIVTLPAGFRFLYYAVRLVRVLWRAAFPR
jgi:hypothetical protein